MRKPSSKPNGMSGMEDKSESMNDEVDHPYGMT